MIFLRNNNILQYILVWATVVIYFRHNFLKLNWTFILKIFPF